MNFVVLFENYNMFCEERDEKLLKVLMAILHDLSTSAPMAKPPERWRNSTSREWRRKSKILTSRPQNRNDTPVSAMTDDLLMKLLESGRIARNIPNNCSLGPTKLLAEVKSFNEQAARSNRPRSPYAVATGGTTERRPERYG